jgi:hypothetical protein
MRGQRCGSVAVRLQHLRANLAGAGARRNLRQRRVRLVDIRRRQIPVQIVAIELAEAAAEEEISHHRVRLVGNPGEVELVSWSIVENQLVVIAVVRVGHPNVVADLVNHRAGQPVTQASDLCVIEAEDEVFVPSVQLSSANPSRPSAPRSVVVL